MIIDGQTLRATDTLTADVCIIGAGAAGLTLAQEFDNASFSVLLIESGGFNSDRLTQSLTDGTTDAEAYPLSTSRARCFGGSTTLWSGVCVPFDSSDFEQRSWLPYSGWPFDKSHLLPYYQRAQAIFGLPQPIPSASKTVPFAQPPLEAKLMQYSRPLDLGRKYQQQIKQSHNITLVIKANVTELIPDPEGKYIERLELKGLVGNKFAVKSRTVILATGGIENARLLLASNTHFPQGLGNQYDLVGRFFMEHYFKVLGILPINEQRGDFNFFTHRRPLDQTQSQGIFSLTDQLRHQQQLLNMHIRVCRYNLLEDTKAVITAKKLQTDRDFSLLVSQWRQLWEDHWTVLPRYFVWHFSNKLNPSAYFDHIRLLACVEQEPSPYNRVTLSQKLDSLGEPQANLTLRFSQWMWDNIDCSVQTLREIFQQQGFGALQSDKTRLEHLTIYNKIGLHHMGTTRMHPDPRYGVVDANCKVHDLANLYISGSSVFPTGGAANPTLTIAALALRLADHIHNLSTNR